MTPPTEPLVRASGLVKRFASRDRGSAPVHAVDSVDLIVERGQTVALVGESGSGKSTTGRMLIRLLEPDAGSLRFDGVDLLALHGRSLRRMRRRFQIVFQDPYASLNPRMKVGSIVGEPLRIHGIAGARSEYADRVADLLRRVGLDPAVADRRPHEFSGGQRQRIGIARAIACSPDFIVADEPVSALDPPVQAQIVNLLQELQESLGLSYLFIAHDLRLVRHVADRVAVMYLGRIVEEGPSRAVFEEPLHPYTRALLASTPALVPGAATPPALVGEPPSAVHVPGGCRFHPRCPVAVEDCARHDPALTDVPENRRVACPPAVK